MTKLCELAAFYGTDKFGGYSAFYDRLFGMRRYVVQKVLEIGIGTPAAMTHVAGYAPGASLRMWRDYFPYAQIYGVDIDESVLFQDVNIHTMRCNQRSAKDLIAVAEWVGEGVDLIVDDGCHDEDVSVFTAKHLMPLVKKGGIYIIEDVNFPKAITEKLSEPHYVVTHSGTPQRQDCCVIIPR